MGRALSHLSGDRAGGTRIWDGAGPELWSRRGHPGGWACLVLPAGSWVQAAIEDAYSHVLASVLLSLEPVTGYWSPIPNLARQSWMYRASAAWFQELCAGRWEQKQQTLFSQNWRSWEPRGRTWEQGAEHSKWCLWGLVGRNLDYSRATGHLLPERAGSLPFPPVWAASPGLATGSPPFLPAKLLTYQNGYQNHSWCLLTAKRKTSLVDFREHGQSRLYRWLGMSGSHILNLKYNHISISELHFCNPDTTFPARVNPSFLMEEDVGWSRASQIFGTETSFHKVHLSTEREI